MAEEINNSIIQENDRHGNIHGGRFFMQILRLKKKIAENKEIYKIVLKYWHITGIINIV